MATSLENFEQIGKFQFEIERNIELEEKITCKKCKQFSGYKSSTLYCLRRGRELKCKNCGNVVLKHL